jgi:hypothetical protein
MPGPSQFQKLRGEGQNSRVQDNIDATLGPIAKALNATPIMGAPPPAWIRPDLAAGFADFGAPYAAVAYHRDALGYVHVKGLVTSAAGVGAFSTVFTLPIGYRPIERHRYASEGTAGTFQALQLGTDGAIMNVVAVAAGGYASIEFTFLAEQ